MYNYKLLGNVETFLFWSKTHIRLCDTNKRTYLPILSYCHNKTSTFPVLEASHTPDTASSLLLHKGRNGFRSHVQSTLLYFNRQGVGFIAY